MPRIGLVGPAYRSQSVSADCQVLMNMFMESIESGIGKSTAALYRTPGLKQLYNVGPSGFRGNGLTTINGRTFGVAGTQFYEFLPQPLTPINWGAVGNDGKPVYMAASQTQVLIVSAGNMYVFTLATNTFAQVAAFNEATGLGLLGTPAQVCYIDGAFFCLLANSNQIQESNEGDGSTWPGVAFTDVSVFPDNVSAILENQRLLWVFGATAIQPYYDSGNFPFSFDVIQGAKIEQGLAAPASPVRANNSIFWMGQDERGSGIFWTANGYTPQRVSTHAMEYEWSTYPTIADCVTFSYQEQGHTIVVLNFPTAQKTWCFDTAIASQIGPQSAWFQKGFWNAGLGNFSMHRAFCHTFNPALGGHLVGDPTTGAVYQQSISIFSDFGNPIRRVRRAPHVAKEEARIFHQEMQVAVETGLGPQFPGKATPTIIPMLDASGALRSFQMGENGILQAPLNPTGDISSAQSFFMNDQNNLTSWQIVISALGVITAVLQPTYIDSYPVAIPFVTVLGDQNWTLELVNLGNGISDLVAIPQGIVGRGPLMTLKWSNDGGHTWSDGIDRDCGQPGEYTKRVIWRRLGQARDRVYELSMTDPADWKLVDAYLFTDSDPVPSTRFATEMAKRA
jgi:hypothetical protein